VNGRQAAMHCDAGCTARTMADLGLDRCGGVSRTNKCLSSPHVGEAGGCQHSADSADLQLNLRAPYSIIREPNRRKVLWV